MVSVLLILLSINSNSQVSIQDSLALVAIYNSTKGENWFQKDYWLSSHPVGEWFGITVQNNRVTRLDLSDNNLSGDIPEAIGDLDSLSFLDFCHDTILSLPNTIGSLSTLDTLALFATVIDTLPAEIGNLHDLKYLSFSYTQIRYLPEEIGGLTKLEYLLGYHGKLRNIPGTIGNLISLKVIDLQVNEISNLPPGIGNCTNLTELWLNTNKIPEIPSEIGNLTNLEYLILGGNNLIDLPDEIFTLTKLKYLNFAANDLKYIPEAIGNLTNLQNFQFFKNNFTYIPGEIGNLVNLTYINGYSNRIDSLPLTLLNLPNVQTLFLAYNALTFEDIEPLVTINGFEYDTQDSIGKRTDTVVALNSAFHLKCLTGGEHNHYQWLKDDDTIVGATENYLEFPSVDFADSGEYRCVVSNSLATGLTLLSRSIKLHIIHPAQEYQAFPTVDGYWKERFSHAMCLDIHMVNPICSEYQYILTGDTVINSLTYEKFTYSGRDRNPIDETWSYWDLGYFGCYRNDLETKRVYYIHNDSVNEVLLYDFNLSVGDTLPDSYVYHPEPGNIIVVDLIDSILVNETYLKRFHLDNAGFGDEYLIEGIGSTMGLLAYLHPYFEDDYQLLCFQNEEEGLYYYEFDSTACEVITEVSEPIAPPGKIGIFPNPATGGFWVQSDLYNEILIEVYNAAGQRLKSVRTTNKVTYIDIAEIPKGMLLINISSGSGYSTRVKLIKQDR